MRILFLNPGAALGGAERALLEMTASLRQFYPQCQITVILGERGCLATRLQALQVTVFVVPLPKELALIGDAGAGGLAGSLVSRAGVVSRLAAAAPAIAAYRRRLAGIISKIAPDLIHSNGFKMHLLGTWAAPPDMPVIWHFHDFPSLRPLMPQLLKLGMHRCRGIIAVSRSVARDLIATFGRTPAVHTVYHSLDLASFAPQGHRLDLDRTAGIAPSSDGTLRIGMVATLARWKGHQVFLRALSMLPAKRLRGYIIGGPIYRSAGSQYSLGELRKMASVWALDGRIGFTGFVNDSAAAFRALDIAVHASVAPEPFGLAVAEAFACGLAVVASRGAGIFEIARENESALAHTPGDAKELAAALARLAADAALRQKLGAAARMTAEKSFPRTRLADDLMRVYDSVVIQRDNRQLESSLVP